VEEALLDFDADGKPRRSALHRGTLEDFRIACDPGAAVDSERFLATRHDEDQSDVRIRQQVLHAIETPVARPIRDREAVLVEHVNEPRRVTLRRHVTPAVRVRGRYHQQGRPCDERAAVGVQRRALLQQRARARRGGFHDRAKFVDAADNVLERAHLLLLGTAPGHSRADAHR
jgi:hypothetical protein